MNSKTFSSIYAEWKKQKRTMVKESSFATYVNITEKHLLPVFGGKSVITESMARNFATMKLSAGLSVNSVRSQLRILRMIVAYGMRHGWTEYNGWAVRLPQEQRLKKLPVLSVPEQCRMVDFLLRNLSLRNIGLYACLCTGMRIGEICALKWGDINLETKSICVRRTVERVYLSNGGQGRTKLIVGQPKTRNSMREIPVSRNLLQLLRPFMRRANASCYVLSNSSRPLEPSAYRRYYQRVLEKAGLPKMKFHGLRHTFATRCVECNCDYKTISSILGHASISTTMNLYVHPNMEQMRKCIDKMLRTTKC